MKKMAGIFVDCVTEREDDPLDKKITRKLCRKIIMVTKKKLAFSAVWEIKVFLKNETCSICNFCPINRTMNN